MYTLKQALRQMIRHRRTSLLLVFSLFVGFGTFILISAGVSYHRSFDKHFIQYKNIYRIVSTAITDNVVTISQPRCQRALGETLEGNYPEVEQSGYLFETMENHYEIGETAFTEDYAYHCSGSLLELLSFHILQGRTEDLLARPYTAVISQSFARKYFADEDPVGQTIIQFPGARYEIEAVYKDLPPDTHFQANLLLSFHENMHLPPPLMEAWGEFGYNTYVKLSPSADLKKLEKAMASITLEHNTGGLKDSHTIYEFELQPIADIHARSHLKNELGQNIQGDYLSILKLISIYILIIAGFNYIYFSYTRIIKNSLQYGVRKILGAKALSLFRLFFVESVIVHTAALILFMLVFTILKRIPVLSGLLTDIHYLPASFWIWLAAIFTISLILNPFIILLMVNGKNSLSLVSRQKLPFSVGNLYSRILTVLQFVIIIFLLASIAGIRKQLRFLESRDKGIDISNKLVIKSPANLRRTHTGFSNLNAFEQNLRDLSAVKSLCISNNIPGDIPSFNFTASEGESRKGIKTAIFIADNSFIRSYNVQILAGRGFYDMISQGAQNEGRGCIINQTFLHQLGYTNPEDVIDKELFLKDAAGIDNIETRVAGVCNDFNFSSMKEIPGPVVLLDWTKDVMWGRYTLTLHPNIDKTSLISSVRENFIKTFPGYSFHYLWLEDYYNSQFSEENRIIQNLQGFAIVAIILGVLSLLSMVWHITISRTKEIGIRKINGAKRKDIFIMLSMDYVKPLIVAFLIACPLIWFALHKWLENFAYKTTISWWLFGLTGALVFFIGFITVSLQSWRVATKNPVEALRYE